MRNPSEKSIQMTVRDFSFHKCPQVLLESSQSFNKMKTISLSFESGQVWGCSDQYCVAIWIATWVSMLYVSLALGKPATKLKVQINWHGKTPAIVRSDWEAHRGRNGGLSWKLASTVRYMDKLAFNWFLPLIYNSSSRGTSPLSNMPSHYSSVWIPDPKNLWG